MVTFFPVIVMILMGSNYFYSNYYSFNPNVKFLCNSMQFLVFD